MRQNSHNPTTDSHNTNYSSKTENTPTVLNSQNISGNSKTTRKTIQSTGQTIPQQAHTTTNPKDATFV